MSHDAAVPDWLGELGPRERTALVALIHIAAETAPGTTAEMICATVADEPFFAAPVRTRAGNELPGGTVLVDFEQVKGYYSKRAEGYVVTANDELKSITSDWYMLTESAATLLGTGVIGGTDATGREFVVNSVVLFPSAAGGIRGEIAVTRYPFNDIVTGDVRVPPPSGNGGRRHLPTAEISHAALLDRLLDAALAHDPERLGALLSEGHSAAFRLDQGAGAKIVHQAASRAEAVAALDALFDGAEDACLLARVSTEWYVFAEYLIRLSGGRRRRFAAIHSADEGRFISTFGYGFDEQP